METHTKKDEISSPAVILRECADWILTMAPESSFAHDELKALHLADAAREAADIIESHQKQQKLTKAVQPATVALGRFVKNSSGVNRRCTACGAYLSDAEFENHTIRFCYFCGVPIEKGDEDGV